MYQFNPLDYEGSGFSNSYTNDASLLFPVNVFSDDYVVPSWENWNNFSGLIAVTASEDGTEVAVAPTATVLSGPGVPSIGVGSTGTISLNRGDVVQLQSPGDLTGSRVTSDKPIQVIGAHLCTNVPVDVSACDHLEESILPVRTLGNSYFVTAANQPQGGGAKERIVRVVAVEEDTKLTFSPNQPPGASNVIAKAGGFIEFRSSGDYRIEADKKVVVAQYMVGAGFETLGDPAMTIEVPQQQYRDSYQFHAPQTIRTIL